MAMGSAPDRQQRSPAWLRVGFLMALAAATYSHLPALRAPVALDDYAQRALIEGKLTPGRSPLNLFDFINRDAGSVLLDRGVIPWWCHVPGEVARFLRPLPSVLIWIDYQLAGYDGFVPHLLSFAWWMAALAAVHVLFRRQFGARRALFGVAVFAVSSAHTVPLLWLANRGVLMTLTTGALALVYYARFRELAQRQDEILSCVLWAITMLTGEYALCFAGYGALIEATTRGESLRQRIRRSMGFTLPYTAYLAAHVALGYTVRGWFFYRNPLEDWDSYVQRAPRALAVLVGSAWFGVDDQLTMTAPATTLLLAGVMLLVALGIVLRHTLSRLKTEQRNRAIWLVFGSVLALVPVLSARPSIRVLGPAVIGASAGVGLILDRASRAIDGGRGRETSSPAAFATRLVGFVLAIAHFVLAPRTAFAFTKLASEKETQVAERLEWVRQRMEPSKPTVVVLRGATPPTAFVAPFMLRDVAPTRWRVLAQAYGQIAVIRSGPRTLEMVHDGSEPLVHFGVGEPVRATPFKLQESIVVPGMRVTIVELDSDGLPLKLRFEFDRDLDDPSFLWLLEGTRGFSEIALPSLGYGVLLPP